MSETELEKLVVRLTGDSKNYQQMLKGAQKSTQDFGNQLGDETGRLAVMSQRVNAFGLQLRGYGLQMAAVGAGIVGVGSAASAAWQGVQIAARVESVEIAFKSLIGNAEEAQAALADLRKFAAETPFEQPEVLAAAKQMLGFGASASEIVPTMQKLGDVASGLEIPLGSLTYLFGTLKAQGRAFMVDINQFAMRGIPIWDELGKQFGVSRAEMRELVEQGKVGFPEVEKAFNAMTGEGGRFHDMMKEQSQTLLGLFSTMKDNINAALADVGKTIIKEFGLKELVDAVGQAAGQIASLFQSMSPGLKTFLASLAGGGAIAAALVASIVAIKVGLAAIVGIVASLGPFGIAMIAAFAAVSVGVAAMVNELGGVGATLEFLKTKATEAWEWLAPVRKSVGDLAETIQGLLSQAWDVMKSAAVSAWQSIFGDVDVNWEKIRSGAVEVFQFIEFSLLNSRKVWDATWAAIKYGAVAAFNSLIHYYTKIIPAAVRYAADAIGKTWETLVQGLLQYAENIGRTYVNLFTDIAKLASGEITGEEFLQDRIADAAKVASGVGKTLQDAFDKLPPFKLPERTEGELERQLREEWQRAANGIQQDFETFKQNRAVRDAFRELFKPREAKKPPAAFQLDQIQESAKAAKKAIEDLSAVRFGGIEFRKLLRDQNFNLRSTSVAGNDMASKNSEQLLKQISANTAEVLKRGFTIVAEANF